MCIYSTFCCKCVESATEFRYPAFIQLRLEGQAGKKKLLINFRVNSNVELNFRRIRDGWEPIPDLRFQTVVDLADLGSSPTPHTLNTDNKGEFCQGRKIRPSDG